MYLRIMHHVGEVTVPEVLGNTGHEALVSLKVIQCEKQHVCYDRTCPICADKKVGCMLVCCCSLVVHFVAIRED